MDHEINQLNLQSVCRGSSGLEWVDRVSLSRCECAYCAKGKGAHEEASSSLLAARCGNTETIGNKCPQSTVRVTGEKTRERERQTLSASYLFDTAEEKAKRQEKERKINLKRIVFKRLCKFLVYERKCLIVIKR